MYTYVIACWIKKEVVDTDIVKGYDQEVGKITPYNVVIRISREFILEREIKICRRE